MKGTSGLPALFSCSEFFFFFCSYIITLFTSISLSLSLSFFSYSQSFLCIIRLAHLGGGCVRSVHSILTCPLVHPLFCFPPSPPFFSSPSPLYPPFLPPHARVLCLHRSRRIIRSAFEDERQVCLLHLLSPHY